MAGGIGVVAGGVSGGTATVALGLASAAIWGTSDFVGGIAARRLPSPAVVTLSHSLPRPGAADLAGADPRLDVARHAVRRLRSAGRSGMRYRRDGALQSAGAGRHGADGGGERRAGRSDAGGLGICDGGAAARTANRGHCARRGGNLDDCACTGIAILEAGHPIGRGSGRQLWMSLYLSQTRGARRSAVAAGVFAYSKRYIGSHRHLDRVAARARAKINSSARSCRGRDGRCWG